MNVLLISPDPAVRETMAVALRSLERAAGETVEAISAKDGVQGIRLAWRTNPDVVIVDEIASRAGAFAVARDLKGASPAFAGTVVILLERPQDAWLAEWSGADAWFVKPVNPFELADAVGESLSRAREEAV